MTDGSISGSGLPHFVCSKGRASFTPRAAREDDCADIARLANAAGSDSIAFILKVAHPSANALQAYQDMIMEPESIFSFKNCTVAVASGRIVGMANAFAASLIGREMPASGLTDRERFLQPRTGLTDRSSYLPNNISVEISLPTRRRGLGADKYRHRRREAAWLSSVTLHVWADNRGAIAFYRKIGFSRAGTGGDSMALRPARRCF